MLCAYCNKETNNKKYCSRSCAVTINNKNLNRKRRQPEGTCPDCVAKIRSKLTRCSDCKKIKLAASSKQRRDRNKASVSEWRRRTKRIAVESKGGACSICGYSRCIRALQFHHRDPAQKDFQISSRVRAWNVVQLEIAKCDLVCANCHAEIHDTTPPIGAELADFKILETNEQQHDYPKEPHRKR